MTMPMSERIFAALSPLLNTRVYPGSAPAQVVRPYAVYSKVSSVGIYTLTKPADAKRLRIEINIYDDDVKPYADFELLTKNVVEAMEGIGGQQADGGEGTEPDTRLRRSRLDFYLWDRP